MQAENSQRQLQELCNITNLPPWAHVLMNTYFANWPALETQSIYQRAGAKCSQYWHQELTYILSATLHYTEQFRSLPHMIYYINKYPGDSVNVNQMDTSDRSDIFNAFCNQLGMHCSIFPYSVSDFPRN